MTYALLINADLHQREMISTVLELDGIDVKAVRDEEEAIHLLRRATVIVWDWISPVIPPEIFIAVLRQERFSGALVICASGREADEMPYDLLIRKPYDLDYLARATGRLMQEVSSRAISSEDSGKGTQ